MRFGQNQHQKPKDASSKFWKINKAKSASYILEKQKYSPHVKVPGVCQSYRTAA
jgi:hypothetical protein